MNKLDRFRFGGNHKRRMRIIGFTTVGVLAIGLGLLAVIGVFGSRSDNVRVVLNEQTNGVVLEGAGLNLPSIPTSNRISNYDFEKTLNPHSYTISSSDSSFLYFETDSGIYSDGVIPGDNVDVYSLDSNGAMSLRFSGTVDGINVSRFGMNNLIEDMNSLWINDPIIDTKASDSIVDAITESGILITDITGECAVPLEDEEFVDLASSGVTIYALTKDGKIFTSVDGRGFNLLMELDTEYEARYIEPSGSNILVLLENGDLWNISNGRSTLLPVKGNKDNLLMVGNGQKVVVIGDSSIYATENGYYFSLTPIPKTMFFSGTYISGAASENSIYLLDDFGQLRVIGDNDFYVLDLSSLNPVQVSCSSEGDILILSENQHVFLVSGSEDYIDLTSGSLLVDSIFQGSNGKVITKSGNRLFMDRVYTGLQVVESVPADMVMSGDICIISSSSSELANYWEVNGEGTYINTASEENNQYMVLSGSGKGIHAASQKLKGASSDNFAENSFYRVELKVKGEVDGNLKVWISGDDITEGIETKVTSKFETVSYVFAVTDSMLNEDDVVRLNISFEGNGQVYIDDVYLGEDKYSISDIPSNYVDTVKAANPAAIRLESLTLGSKGFSREHFYGMYPDSLESAMRLVRDSNSCPWFVIGSDVKQSDINDFLEYLCGPVSTEYGKLRTDNGTALPWNRQFDRIYIEIDDDIGAYVSDVQKGAYVSYVINLFRQSENYIEVRDKVIFVDGMSYEGSTVMSSADFHAMGMTIDFNNIDSTYTPYLNKLGKAYEEFNYEVPRITSHSAGGGEYISSLSFVEDEKHPMNAARLVSIFLNENTDYIKMCMFDLDISDRPVDTESEALFANSDELVLLRMISNLSFIKHTEGMYYQVDDPLSASSKDTAESFNEACTVEYVSDRNSSYLIVANASDSQQQFITEGTDLISRSATITRYSLTGEVLFDRKVKRTDLRYTLQPGEIIVFNIPNE